MNSGLFLAEWMANSGRCDFVHYPSELVAAYGVGVEDQRFLADPGLPAWAAPHLHFFCNGVGTLPPPVDPYGSPLPVAHQGLGMVGSNAEEWPVCLDTTRSGQFVCLPLDPNSPVKLLNSSARQLGACLLAYGRAVDAALKYGQAHGHDDAWRKRQYPSKIDVELQDAMRSIDPDAMSSDAYWLWHFDGRTD